MENQNQEYDVITLTYEDDTTENCLVLAIFETPDSDQQYIALMPESEIDSEESTVYLYRYSEDENGEPQLDDIDNEDEYEDVTDAFEELLDEDEFNSIDE